MNVLGVCAVMVRDIVDLNAYLPAERCHKTNVSRISRSLCNRTLAEMDVLHIMQCAILLCKISCESCDDHLLCLAHVLYYIHKYITSKCRHNVHNLGKGCVGARVSL